MLSSLIIFFLRDRYTKKKKKFCALNALLATVMTVVYHCNFTYNIIDDLYHIGQIDRPVW